MKRLPAAEYQRSRGMRPDSDGNLTTPHADKVPHEESYHDEIDDDGEAGLFSQESRTIAEHEANEDDFAQAGDGQDKRTNRRVECSVDQHRPYEHDQSTPVAHDNLGHRTLERFSKRGVK